MPHLEYGPSVGDGEREGLNLRVLILVDPGRQDEQPWLLRRRVGRRPLDDHVVERGRGCVGSRLDLDQVAFVLRQRDLPFIDQFASVRQVPLADQLLLLSDDAIGEDLGLQQLPSRGQRDARRDLGHTLADHLAR